MPKKKAAVVELPKPNQSPWVAVDGLTVNAEAVGTYTPSGDFKTDYLAYCKMWGIPPHPSLLRSWKAIQWVADERQRAEEAAKAEADRLAGIDPEAAPKKKKKKKKKKKRRVVDPAALTDADIFDMKPGSTVSVRGHRLDSNHVLGLSLALPHCERVTTIKFWNANVSARDLSVLADALPQCPSIKAVYIDWNPLPKAAEVDTPAITGGDSKEGDGAPAEEKGAEEEEGEGKQAAPSAPPAAVFAKFINNAISSLGYLSLRGNDLGEGIPAMAAALRTNTTLGSLNLLGNKIGDGNTNTLFVGLRDNRSLSSLCLSDNSLTDAVAQALVDNMLFYPLTEAEVEARQQFEQSLGGGDTKKKKGKGAAESALPPLEQVKGVWYGRGTESLKALDLSSNFITSSGAASILAGLYPPPAPEPEKPPAPEPEPEEPKGKKKKGKKGGKKGKKKDAGPPPEEKLADIVAAVRELDLCANQVSVDDAVELGGGLAEAVAVHERKVATAAAAAAAAASAAEDAAGAGAGQDAGAGAAAVDSPPAPQAVPQAPVTVADWIAAAKRQSAALNVAL